MEPVLVGRGWNLYLPNWLNHLQCNPRQGNNTIQAIQLATKQTIWKTKTISKDSFAFLAMFPTTFCVYFKYLYCKNTQVLKEGRSTINVVLGKYRSNLVSSPKRVVGQTPTIQPGPTGVRLQSKSGWISGRKLTLSSSEPQIMATPTPVQCWLLPRNLLGRDPISGFDTPLPSTSHYD